MIKIMSIPARYEISHFAELVPGLIDGNSASVASAMRVVFSKQRPLPIKIRQSNRRKSIKVKEKIGVIVETVPNTRSGDKEAFILTLGGRVWCPRCQAKSKRTKLQCQSPAVRDKRACRIHGGLSTGPKTKMLLF